MDFHKMKIENDSYSICHKKSFSPLGSFKEDTINIVFNFAYDMTFGNEGEHRDHRSGGTHIRKKGEIFANTFQGKLAECAVYNQLHKTTDITKPDFETYELGKWDSADLFVKNKKISIKSTKSYGNLLLLETKDWDSEGVYLPNKEAYDYTFLVRLNPYCEDIMRKSRLLYSNSANREALRKIICSVNWEYDIPGFVTLDELKYIINNSFIMPKNAMLNGNTRMDAENYYIQSGDMHKVDEFKVKE